MVGLVSLLLVLASTHARWFNLVDKSVTARHAVSQVPVECPYSFCRANRVLIPKTFAVHFSTKQGSFEVEIHEEWAPQGALHFRTLVEDRFYDDSTVFRVLPWMVQFGLKKSDARSKKWFRAGFLDDPKKQKMTRGSLVFSCYGGQKNARATQVFILKKDMPALDRQNYVPIGQVTKGMHVVDSMHPYLFMLDNAKIISKGKKYLESIDRKLSVIETARLVSENSP